jgi:TolB protein
MAPLRRLALGLFALILTAGCAPTAASVPAVPALLQAREQVQGKLVYVRNGDLWLYEKDAARQLTQGGTWFQPAFSPDGQEIAYVYWENNFADIFVMAWNGASSRRLTRGQVAGYISDNDWAFRPTWSPDGSQIAYVSDRASYFPVVWVMDKDGNNKRQLLTAATGLEASDAISWAPDGKRLATTALAQGMPSQVYLLDVVKGTAEKLTSNAGGAFDPAWSPDGERIAYIGRDGGQGELWVKRLDGGEARFNKLSYVRSPAWSPDGTSLAVLAAQGGTFQVWLIPVQGAGDAIEFGEPRQLTRDGTIDAASGLSWVK